MKLLCIFQYLLTKIIKTKFVVIILGVTKWIGFKKLTHQLD